MGEYNPNFNLFTEAKQILKKNGWTQGAFKEYDHKNNCWKHCVLGAICEATDLFEITDELGTSSFYQMEADGFDDEFEIIINTWLDRNCKILAMDKEDSRLPLRNPFAKENIDDVGIEEGILWKETTEEILKEIAELNDCPTTGLKDMLRLLDRFAEAYTKFRAGKTDYWR